MSEAGRLVEAIAIDALLNAARSLHVNVDELCETAIESLLGPTSTVSPAVALAIDAIEKAADALEYDNSAG
ncbi:hypothetical protein NPS29_12485 [Pseudomonas putida]|uniref:hypothetical protein n=1 Tax=Pseudomonas putida TaxID=303 RepID=UPI002363980A|nr:hypothetical protein [Pseudomonas putida]MDD1966138.1 hypothetical protein [Pseudomonas putida]